MSCLPESLLIVRVLSCKLGAEIPAGSKCRAQTRGGGFRFGDEEVRPHIDQIINRYRNLKKTNDAETAEEIAKAEWLERFIEGVN